MSKNQISAILMIFEDNFKYLVPGQTHREGGDLLVVGYGHGWEWGGKFPQLQQGVRNFRKNVLDRGPKNALARWSGEKIPPQLFDGVHVCMVTMVTNLDRNKIFNMEIIYYI